MFKFGSFDEPDAVVSGEAAAGVAKPGRRDEDGVVGAFVVQDPSERTDVVGWDYLPVPLGLDDVLAAQDGIAVEKDSVDAFVAGAARHSGVHTFDQQLRQFPAPRVETLATAPAAPAPRRA